MDVTPQSASHSDQPPAEAVAELSATFRPSNKTKRNYRSKKNDADEIEDDHGADVEQTQEPEQDLTDSIDTSSMPYVQSQNAQNLGEVYPALARLSFLDQEKGLAKGEEEDDGEKEAMTLGVKPRRPLWQKPQQNMGEKMAVEGESAQGEATTRTRVPPMTSPSALSSVSGSGSGSGSSLVEIRETGSVAKGRGVFSAAAEILKTGTLIFRELGYCQVVNDASLSQVCSACFKDVREEVGEDEGSGAVPAGGQRIQKSMTNSVMKDVWTKRSMDTTTVRALCRLIRRRERVKASTAFGAEHGKLDTAQKQVNEVYFSGLNQKEEEWLDEHGSTWIEQYLNTNVQEREVVESSPTMGTLHETSQVAKILTVVMSCVNTPKEDRHAFLKGVGEVASDGEEGSVGASGLHLLEKLESYGFAITNMETTTIVGLAFYVDQISTTLERQKILKTEYHFICGCPLCKYFPANPLVQPEVEPLKQLVSEPLPEPLFDPKQGFVCPNAKCNPSSTPRPILAVESQLTIYNKVELRCNECGHVSELTHELVQENEEKAQSLISAFMREMNGGSTSSGGSKANARNFELAKTKVLEVDHNTGEDTGTKPTIIGGMKTVEEPSAHALEIFDEAYKALTGSSRSTNNHSNIDSAVEEGSVHRSPRHRLVRQLEQAGFDEAVRHKNWIFALKRSIELECILNQTYVGHHPLKAIQEYYTCKIANLLANLLLEESTVEIEENEPENEDDGKDSTMLDSDDERDLKAIRAAMRKGGRSAAAATAAVGSESIQERLQRRKRKEADKSEEERQCKKRTQADNSKELLQYLKSLIPRIENPKILQEFKVCWGKDGKLATRYRYQIDSMKQALHYAELPFAK
ncbi:hypothetical protein BGZ65_002429 [Modicella reniformis]|uniref:SET domain-containing protein n=1 Tax=Modicella reniformis TaxID=1440133 RepID=A0A9P6SQI9_9FUNG|nr:hypothetical protein BGZ65_002429 [Modicella reniformis]